ncbi:hypothetical protein MSAN_00176500 [Mycena sanguinolenta]|uniref:Uncharacterized protein n=1 Tax=Mycena sanguinolenta TaxID=230812 RepID=A0A8H6ZHK8_9AGAR|nr:hypothetical protein MSAN_00176500 [Mycena sanguinolenta]
MASELDTLLAKLDARFSVNVSLSAVSALLNPGCTSEHSKPRSKLAEVAYKTLRDLANADSELLWRHFGDIIAKWPGAANAQNVGEAFEHEREWVQSFRQNGSGEAESTITGVRNAIALVSVEYDPFTTLPAKTFDDGDDLDRVLAVYHRPEKNIDKISFLPFLPRMERLVSDGLLPATSLDVVVVITAMTIMHELRYMVGTLVHGASFCTLPAVHPSFSPLAEETTDANQGEVADWYELSRYGAILSPALVAPTKDGGLESATLHLTGRRNGGQPRYLFPAMVSEMAERVLDGTFLRLSSPFFGTCSTHWVTGYVLAVQHMGSVDSSGSSTPRPPRSPQTACRYSMVAEPSGPYPEPLVKGRRIAKRRERHPEDRLRVPRGLERLGLMFLYFVQFSCNSRLVLIAPWTSPSHTEFSARIVYITTFSSAMYFLPHTNSTNRIWACV